MVSIVCQAVRASTSCESRRSAACDFYVSLFSERLSDHGENVMSLVRNIKTVV
jgi:hypothetical protein